MAFTAVTVTFAFVNADGSLPSGYLIVQPAAEMSNAGQVVPASPVRVPLVAGVAMGAPASVGSVVLYATDDPGTLPVGNVYRVTKAISGESTPAARYFALPRAVTPVDLSALVPLLAAPQMFTYALAGDLTAETTRATSAEATKATATALTAEATTARAAEGTNATGISAETTRATAAEGANTAAIATKAALLGVAATVTAAGALVVNKHNPVDATSAPLTMTLPTGQPQGSLIIAEKYDASANAVTISGNIRGVGASTDTLVLPHQTTMFEADAAGSWWPVSSHKALATLDGRYAALTTTQSAEGAITPVFSVVPFTAGTAGFRVAEQSFPNTGVGAGTYNQGVWQGFNSQRHTGGPGLVAGKHAWYMGMEYNYYDDGGDATYGPEWYVAYWSPDGTSVQLFRPFYCRVLDGPSNAAKAAIVTFNIGSGAAQFSVNAAGTQAFSVTPTAILAYQPPTFFKGPITLAPTAGQAVFVLNAAAASQSRVQYKIGGTDAFYLQANDVNTFMVYDKSVRAMLTFTYGATAAAAISQFDSKLVTSVSVTTPTLLGSLGANKDIYIIPGAAAGQVVFNDGTQSFVTFQIDATGNFIPRDGKALVANGATGVKLGNATTDKLGFWGHAPVVQPAAPVTLADVIAVIRGCGLSA